MASVPAPRSGLTVMQGIRGGLNDLVAPIKPVVKGVATAIRKKPLLAAGLAGGGVLAYGLNEVKSKTKNELPEYRNYSTALRNRILSGQLRYENLSPEDMNKVGNFIQKEAVFGGLMTLGLNLAGLATLPSDVKAAQDRVKLDPPGQTLKFNQPTQTAPNNY